MLGEYQKAAAVRDKGQHPAFPSLAQELSLQMCPPLNPEVMLLETAPLMGKWLEQPCVPVEASFPRVKPEIHLAPPPVLIFFFLPAEFA